MLQIKLLAYKVAKTN